MTECMDAFTVLRNIMEGMDTRTSSSDFQKLVSLGLIDYVKDHVKDTRTDIELDSIRAQLTKIGEEKETLRKEIFTKEASWMDKKPRWLYKKDPAYRAAKDKLVELEKEERTLRSKFIDLMHATAERDHYSRVNDENMYVTYKGRELLGMLEQRIHRVEGTELGVFLSELEEIKNHFNVCSKKAREILKKISPMFPGTDEIHFRSAAVGLSGKKESPEEIGALFISAYKEISDGLTWNGPVAITLAESLTILADDKSELDSLVKKAIELIKTEWSPGYDKKDQVRAVSIILSSKKDPEDLLKRTKEISEKYSPSWPSPAAFLATQSRTRTRDREDLFQRFEIYRNQICPNSTPTLEHLMAATLMTSTEDPIEEVLQRYSKAKSMLNQFNGSSMEVPSAMIAILPMDVPEAMDNLRLASASIRANRLSLGGMENLSLGMKLLMNSATFQIDVGEKAPSPMPTVRTTRIMGLSVLGITGISIASALVVGAGLLAFHELTLHNLAVRDYAFHPVHMHYIYG